MRKLYFYYFFSLVFSFLNFSCNTNDDESEVSEKFLTANVNGLEFNSDKESSSLIFTREISSTGTITLFVSAISEEGDVIEFMIENFQGVGKYHFGNNFFNNSWLKYDKISSSEQWLIATKGALKLNSNFIEITFSDDNRIEGMVSCKQLRNELSDIPGIINGTFRLE